MPPAHLRFVPSALPAGARSPASLAPILLAMGALFGVPIAGATIAAPAGSPGSGSDAARGSPGALAAQTVEVSVERENLRQEPMGKRLASVNGGTRLRVVGRDGRWRQVVLEGWIWTPSVASTNRGGHDLVVSADGGENLRAGPDAGADVLARLLEGFLLTRLEEQGDWTRVRRTAWMWAPSLRAVEDGDGGGTGAGAAGAPPAGAEEGGEGTGDDPDAAGAAAGDVAEDHRVVEGGPARVHASPEGDTVGVAHRGTDLTVLGRQGDWIRVRLEGWVRGADLVPPDSASAARELSPEQLRTRPDRYRGRRVRWTVQYISLERAEAARTDFYEGEPFMLVRPVAGEGTGFVYLAVPPELLSRVEELRPLQQVAVLGRVRTGRSALMGAPVLDLLELRPVTR